MASDAEKTRIFRELLRFRYHPSKKPAEAGFLVALEGATS